MIGRTIRRMNPCAFAIALTMAQPVSADAADATIKVAFWNIMSGPDPTQPLNAWGAGAT